MQTVAKVANNCRHCQQLQSCQQLQKLPTAAVVAAVAEKGCNSGFKLVIAENLKTVANTNFSFYQYKKSINKKLRARVIGDIYKVAFSAWPTH